MYDSIRYIRRLAGSPRLSTQDCRKVASVFNRYSGDWAGIFHGSVTATQALKRVLRFMKRRGIIGTSTDQPVVPKAAEPAAAGPLAND